MLTQCISFKYPFPFRSFNSQKAETCHIIKLPCTHACKFITWQAEARLSQVQGQHGLITEPSTQRGRGRGWKLSVIALSFNPRTPEAGRSEFGDQSALHSKLQANQSYIVRHCLKRKITHRENNQPNRPKPLPEKATFLLPLSVLRFYPLLFLSSSIESFWVGILSLLAIQHRTGLN